MSQQELIAMPVTRVISEKARNNAVANDTNQKFTCTKELSDESTESALVASYQTCPKRASIEQLEFLAQCMERFPALALSMAKGRHALENSRRKWRQIAAVLNKINPKFNKTGKGWLRYWADVKFKVRRKYVYSRQLGGPRVNLTSFEQRLLRILTDDEGNLICNRSVSDIGHQEDPETNDFPRDDDSNTLLQTEQVTVTDVNAINETTIKEDIAESEEMDDTSDDPIRISKNSIEELQADILRYKLRRQKETHELELEQMRERHKLEMEILGLKKKRLTQEFDRIKQLIVTVQPRRSNSRRNVPTIPP